MVSSTSSKTSTSGGWRLLETNVHANFTTHKIHQKQQQFEERRMVSLMSNIFPGFYAFLPLKNVFYTGTYFNKAFVYIIFFFIIYYCTIHIKMIHLFVL